MEENSEKFEFTYSASEQEEIRRIREKYIPKAKEETTVERLRKLDASVTKTAQIASMTVGILSTLVLGIGMCCVTVWADFLFLLGIGIGILGIAGVIAAYPVYTHMVKSRREKVAPEIMRLSEELMK